MNDFISSANGLEDSSCVVNKTPEKWKIKKLDSHGSTKFLCGSRARGRRIRFLQGTGGLESFNLRLALDVVPFVLLQALLQGLDVARRLYLPRAAVCLSLLIHPSEF
ncbi:hypothetical protein SLA2020_103500 [Shorea laevis]